VSEEIKPNNNAKSRKVYVENGIEIAQKIGKLYVTYRKSYLEQYLKRKKIMMEVYHIFLRIQNKNIH